MAREAIALGTIVMTMLAGCVTITRMARVVYAVSASSLDLPNAAKRMTVIGGVKSPSAFAVPVRTCVKANEMSFKKHTTGVREHRYPPHIF